MNKPKPDIADPLAGASRNPGRADDWMQEGSGLLSSRVNLVFFAISHFWVAMSIDVRWGSGTLVSAGNTAIIRAIKEEG